MSRFVWRLQRLLDVKIKQEDVKRSELVAITEQAAVVRGRIMLKKTMLRQSLADLETLGFSQRLKKQELFLRYSHVFDAEIRALQEQSRQLERRRRMKIDEVLEIRRFRKGLERLRQKAKARFIEEELRLQQKQLDENITGGYARRIMKVV